jgi:hypothetical protein
MSVVAELFDKAGDLILRLWDRGQYFFWAVASVGTAILAVLSAGWWFGLGNAPDLFRAYGFPALILALCGTVFGIWRKLEDRSRDQTKLSNAHTMAQARFLRPAASAPPLRRAVNSRRFN